jgi:hypothetical protein
MEYDVWKMDEFINSQTMLLPTQASSKIVGGIYVYKLLLIKILEGYAWNTLDNYFDYSGNYRYSTITAVSFWNISYSSCRTGIS